MNEDSPKTILIVDDEPDIREVLTISLMDMGYGTLEAENAAQAFDVFVKEQPMIVVTDIKMPGGDGIELLRKIKHENPETEVIMITGHGDMNLAVQSLKHEATDFITKPINVDALEIALNRTMEKIAIRDQLRAYTRNLEQLVKEKIELQDHLAALGLMIGSISHGMKGLLTNMEGSLYLIFSGLTKKELPLVEEGYTAAKETAGRIRKMVQDILFSAKKRELKRKPVNAVAFAKSLAEQVRPRALGNDVELVCRFDEDAGTIMVDVDYLQAALINILDNAVDACIKATDRSPHAIEFQMRRKSDGILFAITDDGIGMDSETRDRIFKLFYSTKERSGTGLGLFIANRIVGQHGGTIHVTSTPGRGTTFKVSIPKTPLKT